jgi:AcrR family transcriptional regulator
VSKGEATRATILSSAVETACLTGLRGLALQPLADRVGLTKSGLYAHFRSRAALERATLDRAAELFQATVVAPAKLEAAGLPRLAGVFERWLRWPGLAGLPGGCPFLAAVLELDQGTPAVRERLASLFREFLTVLESLAASAIRHRHLSDSTDPAALAHDLLALRLAHHWAERLLGAEQAGARTARALANLLARQRVPSA